MNKYIVKLNGEDIPADGWIAELLKKTARKGMIAYWNELFEEITKGKDVLLSDRTKIDLIKLIDKTLDKAWDSVEIIEIENKKEGSVK